MLNQIFPKPINFNQTMKEIFSRTVFLINFAQQRK